MKILSTGERFFNRAGQRSSFKNAIAGKPRRSADVPLDLPLNADIMSDMKTFTVRELDREPAAVLDVADKEGIVRIKRRDGRVYSLRPEKGMKRMTALPDFASRRNAIFSRTIPASQVRLVDKAIAGE